MMYAFYFVNQMERFLPTYVHLTQFLTIHKRLYHLFLYMLT